MAKKYKVLSPDGFEISFLEPTYKSLKQAKQALQNFCDGYKFQGYYSQVCYNGYRRQIPVEQIADYCDIITL